MTRRRTSGGDGLTIRSRPDNSIHPAAPESPTGTMRLLLQLLLSPLGGGKLPLSLSLSLLQPMLARSQRSSGDLPTNMGKALKGSKVNTHPSLSPSFKVHWRMHPDPPPHLLSFSFQPHRAGRLGVKTFHFSTETDGTPTSDWGFDVRTRFLSFFSSNTLF